MNKLILILYLFSCALFLGGYSPSASERRVSGVSAVRGQNENYLSARNRIFLNEAPPSSEQKTLSVWDTQGEYSSLNLEDLPEVASAEELQLTFQKLRDVREWYWAELPNFRRRIPWLYPEDGCFSRADLMDQKLTDWKEPRAHHVFIFGNISATNDYGTYFWWFHVAPVVKLKGEAYVIDPAVFFEAAIPLKEWILKMTSQVEAVKLSLCGPAALYPFDRCNQKESTWDAAYKEELVQEYLRSEWVNLEKVLNHTPAYLLGESPPLPPQDPSPPIVKPPTGNESLQSSQSLRR